MARKTPQTKRTPNTLDAISGSDAIEVLRILANQDKKLSMKIDVIARELLADVDVEEIANCVRAQLDSLSVEDVWDRSGSRRHGYVSTGETAQQMFEDALESFHSDMLKYQQLSMHEQAEATCLGIIKGIYDFHWYSENEFKDWAIDTPADFFGEYIREWKKHFQKRSSLAKLNQFLSAYCVKWAE